MLSLPRMQWPCFVLTKKNVFQLALMYSMHWCVSEGPDLWAGAITVHSLCRCLKTSSRQQRFLAISFQIEFALGNLNQVTLVVVICWKVLYEWQIYVVKSLVLAAFLSKTITFWELNQLHKVFSDLKFNIMATV